MYVYMYMYMYMYMYKYMYIIWALIIWAHNLGISFSQTKEKLNLLPNPTTTYHPDMEQKKPAGLDNSDQQFFASVYEI